MTRARWITALARAVLVVGQLRSVLTCFLVISMLVSAVPAHAGHELAQLNTHAEVTEAGPVQPDGVDPGTDFDCSVHSECHAVTLVDPVELSLEHAASTVSPERRNPLAGVLAPPLPHPPNHS